MSDPHPNDHNRARAVANIGAAVVVLLLLALGYWLTNALTRQSRLEDCMLAHRRTCAGVETPGG